MKSRVHPTYKTRYRVGNWRVYERALVRRGDVTLWLSPDATAAWRALSSGRPGGQLRFSDVAIETALTLRLVFHLPLRQTKGFVRSILTVMRYKSIIGDGLRARCPGGRALETSLACSVLNRLTEIGRSESSAISR